MNERAIISGTLAFLLGFTLMLGVRQTFGQEHHSHPPQDEALHDKFYSTWMRPVKFGLNTRRTISCCSKLDCYPAEVKREGGTWFVKQRETGNWVVVPDEIIEQNQPDPRESPDGRAHVCLQASFEAPMLYCFTHGGGT